MTTMQIHGFNLSEEDKILAEEVKVKIEAEKGFKGGRIYKIPDFDDELNFETDLNTLDGGTTGMIFTIKTPSDKTADDIVNELKRFHN